MGGQAIHQDTRQALIDIVGAEHLLCYAYDASPIPVAPAHAPSLVVFPGCTEEVSPLSGPVG